MKRIKTLQIHVAHGCNLACQSCSHYSNQQHKGLVSLEEADAWMQPWRLRLYPEVFTLLGGEPTIHPRLPEFLSLARSNWPAAELRIVTNGFFLHRHPNLPRVLRDDPNTRLCLSIHHDAPEYREKIQPILTLLADWTDRYGIRVDYRSSFKNWTRRYKGYGSAMEPYTDGQPRRSWENCPAKYCTQLFEGSLWKCAPLAYLKIQDAKHHLSNQWKPFLDYQPLAPDCSEEALNEFFAREEEAFCGMCPANPELFELPIPLPLRSRRSAANQLRD